MLHYAALFFLFALIMAAFGFAGVAVTAMARLLFVVFMVGSVAAVLLTVVRRV